MSTETETRCAHGIVREIDDCAECARLAHAQFVRRLAWMPINARPVSHDETPSGITSGDRVDFFGAQDGMTLRQHYAGLAMQGALASDPRWDPEPLARYAVKCADALIAELAK